MSLELRGIHKVYSQAHAGETLEALRDINLTVEAGTFMSIIGPSGCGKTTLLRIICGLESPPAAPCCWEEERSTSRTAASL